MSFAFCSQVSLFTLPKVLSLNHLIMSPAQFVTLTLESTLLFVIPSLNPVIIFLALSCHFVVLTPPIRSLVNHIRMLVAQFTIAVLLLVELSSNFVLNPFTKLLAAFSKSLAFDFIPSTNPVTIFSPTSFILTNIPSESFTFVFVSSSICVRNFL